MCLVLNGYENLQRQMEEAQIKAEELRRRQEAEELMNMSVQELQEKLQLLRQQNGSAVVQRDKELEDSLQEKNEMIEDLESLNQTLLIKERQSNDELQEARKELIDVSRIISIYILPITDCIINSEHT